MKLYLAVDTGPSGFGEASRGLLKELLKTDIDITCRTHFWGLNKEGMHFSDRNFPDIRFAEYLLRNDIINEDYLIDDPREIPDREVNLTEDLGSNKTMDSDECLVRQFEGQEDIWLAAGAPSFAEQAPKKPYTILSTDYNLDIVPRDWEYYLNQVDEVWVPSEWTRDAILNRLGDDYKDKVYAFPYGIEMEHRPTEYDCEVCPHNKQQAQGPPQRCLRDDSFNFLVISRFYHIKGLYRTIKAFIKEFRNRDKVRMFIKTTANNQFQFDPVQSANAIVNELGYTYDPPEIGFAVDSLEVQYLYDLMKHCDAFLQFSRAECFGIAQLQAAYCGTPVAYTNWSAQREIIDEDNRGFFNLDDYELEKPTQEFRGMPFEISDNYPPDSEWAVPDVESIQEIMRTLFEINDNEISSRGQDASKYVKNNFTWNEAIKPRLERLEEVA